MDAVTLFLRFYGLKDGPDQSARQNCFQLLYYPNFSVSRSNCLPVAFFLSGLLQSSHFQAINVTAYHLKRDCCGHKGPINIQTLFHCKEKWVLYTEVVICGPCHKEEERFHTLPVDLSKVIIKNYYVSLNKFLLPNSLESCYRGLRCSRQK